MSFLKKYKSRFMQYSFYYLISLAVYFLSYLILSVFLSFICKNADLGQNIIDVFSLVFIGISGCVCGYFAGILFKKKGVVITFVINALLFLIKYGFALFVLDRSAFLPNYYIVILIDFITILTGCVMAVNKKPKKYY